MSGSAAAAKPTGRADGGAKPLRQVARLLAVSLNLLRVKRCGSLRVWFIK